ncbi:MAG: iron-containing alcohol dehydrogenase [Blautia sp.]
MADFMFYQPTRIDFGAGKLEKAGEIVASYGDSCLLVTTTNKEDVLRPLYDRVKKILEKAGIRYVHFDEVVPNPDIRGIAKAIEIVNKEKLQVILAVGGGSSMDTAKSVALFHDAGEIHWKEVFSKYSSPSAVYELPGKSVLPVIAVPTTAGTGSELTQAMIISDQENNDKECVYHQAVFPRVAIIDPELCRTLPPYPTAITGFDAFTHSFESYVRELASPYTMLLGKEAMRTIVQVLPKLVKDTSNMEYRESMSRAAAFSGISLSNASATIPHPLSEVIGGVTPRIAHGQCLACLYPAFIRFQITKTPEKCADVARLFDPALAQVSDEEAASHLPAQIEGFLKEIGLYNTLSNLGVTKEQFEEMKGNFVFNVLPFAPKETLIQIMNESYGEKL